MFEIEIKSRELAGCIANSPEYIRYRECLEKIRQDDFLMVRINDYRRRNFEIHINGNTNVKQMAESLQREFMDVFENDEAKDFLDAEMALCRMLQKVNSAIMADIELDIVL